MRARFVLPAAALCATLLLAVPIRAQKQAARPVPAIVPAVEITGPLAQRQRASLAGLGPLVVTVGALPPDAEAAGLHQAAILSDVQSLLKRSGVPVTTRPTNPNGPRLTINAAVQKVGGPKSTGNAYTVLLLVEVVQPVVIERSGAKGAVNRRIALPTWRLLDYTVIARESLPNIRTRIGQSVGAFVADYKAANPSSKKAPVK